MHQQIRGARRRIRIAAATAVAAFAAVTIGAGPASAATYYYVGSTQGVYFYMCKTTTVYVKGQVTTSSAGQQFRVQARPNTISTWSSGNAVTYVSGNASYVVTSYGVTTQYIYVRGLSFQGASGGATETIGVRPSNIRTC